MNFQGVLGTGLNLFSQEKKEEKEEEDDEEKIKKKTEEKDQLQENQFLK